MALPNLPSLQTESRLPNLTTFDFGGFLPSLGGSGPSLGATGINIGLPGGVGIPGVGTISLGGNNASIGGTVGKLAGGALSSVLGIPAINWGRIAAFLLGLILIAIGLFIATRKSSITKVIIGNVKSAVKTAAETSAEA